MLQFKFDHYTIRVASLEKSADFYKNVLHLKEIKNRTEKSYIRWFDMGDGKELHITEGDNQAIQTNVGVHMALRLKEFDDFLDHLKTHNITPHNSKGIPNEITIRTDGVRQVYFKDPDHYWIEVNEAEAFYPSD